MAAEGTSTAFIVSAVCFLLTFGSCFVVPSIGQEIGYFKTGEYDILMPMMLGAFLFLPLAFGLGGAAPLPAARSASRRDLPPREGANASSRAFLIHVKLLGLHVPRMVLAALAPPHTGDLWERHTL